MLERRPVMVKAEYQAVATNLRFVVTSGEVASKNESEQFYDEYIQRGKSE